MKQASFVFALLSVLTGLQAALLWWLSTQVNHLERWDESIDAGNARTDPNVIVDWLNTYAVWILKISDALLKSGKINKEAAEWTAASIVLGGLSNLIGFFII